MRSFCERSREFRGSTRMQKENTLTAPRPHRQSSTYFSPPQAELRAPQPAAGGAQRASARRRRSSAHLSARRRRTSSRLKPAADGAQHTSPAGAFRARASCWRSSVPVMISILLTQEYNTCTIHCWSASPFSDSRPRCSLRGAMQHDHCRKPPTTGLRGAGVGPMKVLR